MPDQSRSSHPSSPAVPGPGSPPAAVPLTTPDAGAGAPTGPYEPAARRLPDQAGKYRIEAELGHGGMGVVFRGHDPDFGRSLAIKVLLDQHAGHPGLERRFLEEAHVTGRLQHPGVAPVHVVGRLPDGRPFFSMKLVEGRTLAELLKGRAPGDLPRFLTVFSQMCQTLAYAHSRGVLHRDVKPGNVMVGAFGEVQVMDWGLAKVLADVPAGESDGGGAPAQGLHQTQAGIVVGTFAYMPPEQANAEPVDERADVFSLGATLCEILTGRPPYTGKSSEAVWGKARACALGEAFARLDACGADAELVALARRCLSAKPEDRPRDAAEVARGVAAYLTGVEERARQAEQDRAAAQARAEEAKATVKAERRARRMTVGLATAVLVLAATGGVVVFRLQQQRAEAAHKQQEADSKARNWMDLSRAVLKVGWDEQSLDKLEEARLNAEKAVANAADASDPVKQEAAQFLEEAAGRILAARKNHALLTAVLEVTQPQERFTYDKAEGTTLITSLPSAEQQFAAAFLRWGVDIDRTSNDEIVARLRDQPAFMVQEVVAGLDQWALERWRAGRPDPEWHRLLDLAERLDGNERRRQVRQLLLNSRVKLALLAVAPQPLRSLNPDWEKPRTELLRVAGTLDVSREPVLAVLSLARALEAFQEPKAAEALLRQAASYHPNEAALLYALGEVLEDQSPPRLGEAIEYYRAAAAARPQLGIALSLALANAGRLKESEDVLRKLVRQGTDNPGILLRLGNVLKRQKKLGEAVVTYRRAIELQPNDAFAYTNLASALWAQKQFKDAIEAYKKAAELQPDGIAFHNNLGDALRERKDFEGAEAAHRKALALKPSSATTYTYLGLVFQDRKKLDEALGAYRKAIELQPDYAAAHCNLGTALRRQHKLVEAIDAYRKAVEYDPEYATAYNNLGLTLRELKRYEEALTACRKAIELEPDYARAHENLAATLRDQKKPAEAFTHYRKAIELQPEYVPAHVNFGNFLREQKKPADAIAQYRKAIELQPDHAVAYNSLGVVLSEQKKLDEAVAAFRKSLELQPHHVPACHLGDALREQKKPEEAVAAYRKGAELEPTFAFAHAGLGGALSDLKKWDEAETAFRQALKLQPNNATFHHSLGAVLVESKRLDDALQAYRKVIQLEPDKARGYAGLGSVWHQKNEPDRALEAYRKAIDIQPDAQLYVNVGFLLYTQKKLDEAGGAFRKATELGPRNATAFNNLGAILRAQGKLDEAVKALRKACELEPDSAMNHHNLGAVLHQQRKLPEAAAVLTRAVALGPRDASTRYTLGKVLSDQRKWDEAVAAFRESIRLRPDASVYNELGMALYRQDKLAQSADAFRKAVELKPGYVTVWVNLGAILKERRQLAEAAAALRKAIELKPDLAIAHHNLAVTLVEQKKLAEALAAHRKAKELAPFEGAIVENLRRTERWIEFEKRFPLLRDGHGGPDSPQEQVELARYCAEYRQAYRTAARFYADAFTARPLLGANLNQGHRYRAACAAALAASGKGTDAGALPDKVRDRLRQQALGWLRADLAGWARALQTSPPQVRPLMRQTLTRWQTTADLAGIRDRDALATLHEGERAAFAELWADVDALLQAARKAE